MLIRFSKNFQPDQAFLQVAALIEAGDLQQARSAANTLPENTDSRYLRGVCALSCGEPGRALVELEFAIREPDFPAAHLALAGAFFAARQPGRAAAAFRKGIELLQGDCPALMDYGKYAFEQGWFAEAEIALSAVLNVETKNASALFLLAGAVHSRGDFEKAIDLYEQLLVLRPDLTVAWQQMAKAQRSLGWYLDALKSWEKVLRLDPGNAQACAEAGRMRFQFGQFDDAESLWRQSRQGAAAQDDVRLTRVRVETVRDWCARHGAEYEMVRPARNIELTLPNIVPAEEAHHWRYIQHDRVNEVYLARIENAEVLTRQFAVCAPDGALFLEGLVTTPSAYLEKGNPVIYLNRQGDILLAGPKASRRIKEACVLIGGQTNHFHWTWEGVARMMQLERPELAGLPIVIPAGLAKSQLKMLEVCGITPERCIFVEPEERLVCDDLRIPSLVTRAYVIPPEAVHYMRTKFAHIAGLQVPHRRIYLSRNRIGRRTLINEEELLPMLRAKGFETIYPETLDFSAMMRLFAEAEAVFSIDGAALANLYMAPERIKVGVIATSGLFVPHYYYISHALGHQFTYLHGLPIYASHENLAHRDLMLPKKDLEAFLGTI